MGINISKVTDIMHRFKSNSANTNTPMHPHTHTQIPPPPPTHTQDNLLALASCESDVLDEQSLCLLLAIKKRY